MSATVAETKKLERAERRKKDLRSLEAAEQILKGIDMRAYNGGSAQTAKAALQNALIALYEAHDEVTALIH